MKSVKTDWRNSLTEEALVDLIRINLHSADIKEYNPDPAIHLWNKAAIRGRRPTQKTWWKLKRKQNNQHCDNIVFSQSSSDDSDTDSELDDHEPNNVTALPEFECDAAALSNLMNLNLMDFDNAMDTQLCSRRK